jgi:thymidylate kinase
MMKFNLFKSLIKKNKKYLKNDKKDEEKINTKIHVLSGPIGTGKTTHCILLKEYLEKKNRKVYYSEEITLKISTEMNFYYKMIELIKNEDRERMSSIYFWIQDKIISEYKRFVEEINFNEYDDIVLERTFLDTKIFTIYGIRDEYIIDEKNNISIKEVYIEYLDERIKECDTMFENRLLRFNNVIYIDTDIKNCIRRIEERIGEEKKEEMNREGEKSLNIEKLNTIYKEELDNVYPKYVIYENNENLEEEECRKKFFNFLDLNLKI